MVSLRHCVWVCRSIFLFCFVLSCFFSGLSISFILFLFFGGRGANNYISWIWQSSFFSLIKDVNMTSKLPVLARSLQFYSGYFERESIWIAWRHGESLGRSSVKFETTLWWLLKVFRIVKRGFTLRFWGIPPNLKLFFRIL